MSISLKSHEQIPTKENIIEEIIIKDKKPYKKKTKIIMCFIIMIVLLLIILLFFLFNRYYKEYQKNTHNNFNNTTSSEIIIENKTNIYIINKTDSIIMNNDNNDNTSDMINHNIDSDIIIDKETEKNIINNTSQEIFDNDTDSNNITTENIYPWEKEKLIIHALGEYNKTIYTNSLDSLSYWYFEENMTVFEADFFLTRDNHIVLAHDFNHLKSIPNLEEFKNNTRTPGNLTPMTFEDLVIFMEENNDLYIITDTKYSDKRHIEIEFDEMTEILSRHEGVNERFIIEIYNEEMFLFLKEKNYPFIYFMFTLTQRWRNPNNLEDLENIFKFSKENEINGIIMFHYLFGDPVDDLSKKYSIPVYLHTVNNLTKIYEYFNEGIKGIMTDNVSNKLYNEYLLNKNNDSLID